MPNKCKHGVYGGEQCCAICKDWPSLEKMQNKFPNLSREQFLIMTPTERLRAVETGRLENQ